MSRDQRLVWRQLSTAQPNVAPLLRQANEGFNNAAEAAGSILERYQTGREAAGDREAARRLAGINDEAELDTFLANGGLADLNISREMQANLMNMRGTALGYENDRSVTNQRDTQTQLAVNADQRLQGDWDWNDGRRREGAQAASLLVPDRIHGQQHGTTGGSQTVPTGADDNAWLDMRNQGATRNQPLSPELTRAMSFLGDMGITFRVNSGGQDPAGTPGARRTGSNRHDHGNAADGDLYMGDTRLDWNNPDHVPILQEVVARARLNGVTGIGGSNNYMGAGRMHFGFGSEAVWGGSDHTRAGLLADGGEWLAQAYDNPQQYANRSGEFTPQSAASAVQGGSSPRGALLTFLENSQYLSIEDVDNILDLSDDARSQGDQAILDQLESEQQDAIAAAQTQAIANPENRTVEDVTRQSREILRELGIFSSSEENDAMSIIEKNIAGSEVLQRELAPEVEQDLAASNIVAGAQADMQQALRGTPQGRIQVDTQRFMEAEDPIVELEQMLNLDGDGQAAGWWGGLLSKGQAGYDRNNLRNLIETIANDNNLTEAQAAAVAREIFNRDPTSFLGFNANTLENRFEVADAAEMARQVLNPEQISRFGDANRRAAEIQQDLQQINDQILQDQQSLAKARQQRNTALVREIEERIAAGLTQMTALRSEAGSIFSSSALAGAQQDPAQVAIAEAAARREQGSSQVRRGDRRDRRDGN